MSNPCSHCGCMLSDNLGCPEMEHCYDYHVWKDPGFIKTIEILNPLVEEMIWIRVITNRNKALVCKSPEEKSKLLKLVDDDLKILDDDYHKYMKRLMFDV